MIRVRLLDEEQLPESLYRDGAVGAVLDDACVAVRIRVVDVELVIRLVTRMKRETEEALLAAGLDEAADVEERPGAQFPVHRDLDVADLLDHVEDVLLAGRRREPERRLEPTQQRAQTERRPYRPRACAPGAEHRNEHTCEREPHRR